MTHGNRTPVTLLLAAIWLGHSVILLVFEPAMGFREIRDFFDLAKVVPALESAAWFASNALHVATGVIMLYFQSELRSRHDGQRLIAADTGLAAAPLFIVIGMSGFVGRHLLDIFQSDPGALDASLYGLLAVRAYVLAGAVALIGVMILMISLHRDLAKKWVRVLGVPLGLAAVLFILLPSPAPVLFLVWTAAFYIGSPRP